MIRVNSLVHYDTIGLTDRKLRAIPADFRDGTPVVFLGEIPNMPGYGVFATLTKTYIGVRIDHFVEVDPAKT